MLRFLKKIFGVSGAAGGTVIVSLFTAAYSTAMSARFAAATVDVARLGRIVVANAGVAAVLLGGWMLLSRWVALLIALISYPVWLYAVGLVGYGRRAVDLRIGEPVPR